MKDPNSNSENSDKTKSIFPILDQKLQKILVSHLEMDTETQGALCELSKFFSDNSLKGRRNLRSEVERKSLEINLESLSALKDLSESFDSVYESLTRLSISCTEMQGKLGDMKQKTKDLRLQTLKLRKEKKENEAQSAVISKFETAFTLDPSLRHLLLSNSIDVSSSFFEAIDRLEVIRKNAKLLLHSGIQTTALEILVDVSSLEEKALEKLARWTNLQWHHRSESINANTRKALMYLQGHRRLFEHVLEGYSLARKDELTHSFLSALSSGSEAIELQAHNPLRYIGDILAWLHTSIPTEKDSLLSLLQLCHFSNEKDELVKQSLSLLTEGLSKPLVSRLEHVFLSESSLVTLFSLCEYLEFYSNTFETLIHSSPLSLSILDSFRFCESQVQSKLKAFIDEESLRLEGSNLSHDLTPPPIIINLLSLLNELLSSVSLLDVSRSEFKSKELLRMFIEPCKVSLHKVVSSFSQSDISVFLLNSYSNIIQSSLLLFPFTESTINELRSEMEGHLEELSSRQSEYIVAQLGLLPIVTILSEERSEPLSKIRGLEESHLKYFEERFHDFLISPELYLIPQGKYLLSPNHRRLITRQSNQVILASYTQLYTSVMDPVNEYESPETLLSKSPEQVKLLLQFE